MVLAYLRHLSRARDEHSLHSPFLFALYTQVIRSDNRREPAFVPIRALAKELRQDRELITITDLGAGSKVNTSRQRAIGDVARNSQKPARFARLLFRLIRRFQARTILDLGTSLGITTAYLAQAASLQSGRVLTVEGCPETARIAQQNFDRLAIRNVEIVVGNIDETLDAVMRQMERVDFVFFDANHRYESTVRYFEICLQATHNETVFVFDDIHWSAEMEQAWAYIKGHAAVRVTVDLFWVGLVFFRREQPKQDFTLQF